MLRRAIENTENSLEKIKCQLASTKRSESLTKWNERWVILDPTMEYELRRTEPTVKGTILFYANCTITVSPVNFNGLPKDDRCCIYIDTPQ